MGHFIGEFELFSFSVSLLLVCFGRDLLRVFRKKKKYTFFVFAFRMNI